MMTYDDWKLMSPDEEHRTYDCDCYGKATPSRYIRLCWAFGTETFACPACRGINPEDYDD